MNSGLEAFPTNTREMLRFFTRVIALAWVGIKIFGTRSILSPLRLQYALWNSLGSDLFGPNERDNNDFAFGGSLSLLLHHYVRLGTAGYTQVNPSFQERRENNLNIFGVFKPVKPVEISVEYTIHDRGKGRDNSSYHDAHTFYTGINYEFIDNLSLYYRFERGNDEKRTGNTGGLSRTDIHAIAITWWPIPQFRLTAEGESFQFRDSNLKDYEKIILSGGVIF